MKPKKPETLEQFVGQTKRPCDITEGQFVNYVVYTVLAELRKRVRKLDYPEMGIVDTAEVLQLLRWK